MFIQFRQICIQYNVAGRSYFKSNKEYICLGRNNNLISYYVECMCVCVWIFALFYCVFVFNFCDISAYYYKILDSHAMEFGYMYRFVESVYICLQCIIFYI